MTASATAQRWVFWHGLVAVVAVGTLWWFGIGESGQWLFWLALGWGAVLLIHQLIVKSFSVDEDWAYGRAHDLRQKSYDHRHMNAIRGHYIIRRPAPGNAPPAVKRPADGREPQDNDSPGSR